MDKKILSLLIVVFSIIISGVIVGSAITQAQESSIQYPVKELGNCQNKSECKTYCDNSKNIDTCLAFAEKHSLMNAGELSAAKKFKKIGMIGPGGCDGKDGCDKYCSNSNHMEECISFAQENGLMSGKELEESQKVLAAIKKGVKPPACNGKEECDTYCSSSDHMEECINFSIAAGLMPAEEQEKAQKMLSAIKQGIKPPACRGEEECQSYCSQDAHIEECVKFGEATGMMKKEDADMMRKTGGKGPGGCKGKQECESFCNTPENQETCMNFVKDNGLMSQGDLQKMEQGKQQMGKMFDNMPPQVSECLNSALGSEMVNKLKDGSVMPPREIGEKMRTCFENFRPESPEGMAPGQEGTIQPGKEQGTFGPGRVMQQQTQGPGGCSTPEECKSYCETHMEECQNFRPSTQSPGSPNTQDINNNPQRIDNGQTGGSQGLEGWQVEEQYRQQMGPQDQQIQQYQQQTEQQMRQGIEQIIQNRIVPQEGFGPEMMQQIQQMQQQPMQSGPGSNIAPPPAEPAPQPAPQQEPAPTTLNSNNLFGTIIKPFVKIFGL